VLLQIVEDFATIYPQYADKFCTTWPNLSAKLLPVLHAVKDRELRKLIDLYLCNDDGTDTAASTGLYSTHV